MCPAPPTGSTVLCSAPGPSDRAEDSQPLPRRDAHILESERPQIYPAALRDLGRAVTSPQVKRVETRRGVMTGTFQLARPSNIEYLYWTM